jgi:Fe-S cluster assembly iron-binding protein IscA
MLEITADTKKNIRKCLAENPGKYLRLVVEGDGCAGPYFNLSLDEAGENEYIIKVDGIDILVSDHVKKLAAISTIRIFFNPDQPDSA